MRLPALLALLLVSASAAVAGTPVVPTVKPVLETTPFLPDNRFEADADDPAIWVSPSADVPSLVVTAVKDGGIRVYDLKGKRLQVVDPVLTRSQGDGRINNVDIAYGVKLKSGKVVDVAVASDRGLDRIRFYRIDGGAAKPLVNITRPSPGRAFPKRPLEDGTGLEANPLDDQATIYGLAVWSDPVDGRPWVIGTQRKEPRLGVYRVEAVDGDRFQAVFQYDIRVPVTHDGQNLRQENDDDPRRDWSPQFEGLVVDQRYGILYAGQEDVGIWRIDLKQGSRAVPRLLYETRGSTKSSFREPNSVIARDVEGLTIYYGKSGGGYLLASSQGGGHGDDAVPDKPYDDSFVVFRLNRSFTPKLVGSFRVGKRNTIDATQESDGADVVSNALPGFPNGLFITQDGYDDDLNGLDGEEERTNFKYVDWAAIARSFSPPLAITPDAFDPRRP